MGSSKDHLPQEWDVASRWFRYSAVHLSGFEEHVVQIGNGITFFHAMRKVLVTSESSKSSPQSALMPIGGCSVNLEPLKRRKRVAFILQANRYSTSVRARPSNNGRSPRVIRVELLWLCMWSDAALCLTCLAHCEVEKGGGCRRRL